MCIKTFDEYYQGLQEKMKSEGPDFELNENRAHNTTIMRFMLDNSNVINMYCGEMSVFRNSFYSHINQNANGDEPLGDLLKKELVNSLTRFMERDNTQLNIYLEKYSEVYFRDLINEQIFDRGMASQKINIYRLDDKLMLKSGLLHVSYTDTNIVRMERDKSTHEAICVIKASSDMMDKWKRTFLNMKSAAERVCMPN